MAHCPVADQRVQGAKVAVGQRVRHFPVKVCGKDGGLAKLWYKIIEKTAEFFFVGRTVWKMRRVN